MGIYVQPHLNGLRPDKVLLHPRVGVAVFEIKDWDLRAMRYYAKKGRDGRPMLMACDKRGKHFSREADNPINCSIRKSCSTCTALASMTKPDSRSSCARS